MVKKNNHLTGNVKDYREMDNFTFYEQFYTYKNYGFAFDPS